MKNSLHTYITHTAVILTVLLAAGLILVIPDLALAHGGEEEAVPDTFLRGIDPKIAFGGAIVFITAFGFVLFKIFGKKQ